MSSESRAFDSIDGAYLLPGDDVVTISLTAAATADVTIESGAIYWVVATVGCHIVFDATADASTTGHYFISAGVPIWGQSPTSRVSAIKAAGESDGILYLVKTKVA